MPKTSLLFSVIMLALAGCSSDSHNTPASDKTDEIGCNGTTLSHLERQVSVCEDTRYQMIDNAGATEDEFEFDRWLVSCSRNAVNGATLRANVEYELDFDVAAAEKLRGSLESTCEAAVENFVVSFPSQTQYEAIKVQQCLASSERTITRILDRAIDFEEEESSQHEGFTADAQLADTFADCLANGECGVLADEPEDVKLAAKATIAQFEQACSALASDNQEVCSLIAVRDIRGLITIN